MDSTDPNRPQIFDLVEDIKNYRNKAVIPHDLDYMCLICGKERTAKSTTGLFICSQIDPMFTIKNVCFTLKEYLRLMMNSEIFGSEISHTKLPQWYEGNFKLGSAVLFDEGGTQAYSREFYKAESIELNKAYIGGGMTNLMHFICVPKPRSLDQYPREERLEMLLYTYREFKHDYRDINRGVLVYSREKIDKIFDAPKWWKYFKSSGALRKKFRPDDTYNLPNLKNYIPELLLGQYRKKKYEFGFFDLFKSAYDKLFLEDELGKIALEVYQEHKSTKQREKFWSKRTGLSGRSFRRYIAKILKVQSVIKVADQL
jgi:hypothetical protein